MLYNERLKSFVMWMHVDDAGYDLARVGVAVSSSPTGPFKFLRSFRPHGQQSRDFTVFKVSSLTLKSIPTIPLVPEDCLNHISMKSG